MQTRWVNRSLKERSNGHSLTLPQSPEFPGVWDAYGPPFALVSER